jgi:uncharacterized protein (DUF433 family)
MVDWSYCTAVELDPEVVSGAWVFRGTRVPVVALFENLEDGVTVNEFVELFPGINLMHARSVLEHAARSAIVLNLENLIRSRETCSIKCSYIRSPCVNIL